MTPKSVISQLDLQLHLQPVVLHWNAWGHRTIDNTPMRLRDSIVNVLSGVFLLVPQAKLDEAGIAVAEIPHLNGGWPIPAGEEKKWIVVTNFEGFSGHWHNKDDLAVHNNHKQIAARYPGPHWLMGPVWKIHPSSIIARIDYDTNRVNAAVARVSAAL